MWFVWIFHNVLVTYWSCRQFLVEYALYWRNCKKSLFVQSDVCFSCRKLNSIFQNFHLRTFSFFENFAKYTFYCNYKRKIRSSNLLPLIQKKLLFIKQIGLFKQRSIIPYNPYVSKHLIVRNYWKAKKFYSSIGQILGLSNVLFLFWSKHQECYRSCSMVNPSSLKLLCRKKTIIDPSISALCCPGFLYNDNIITQNWP